MIANYCHRSSFWKLFAAGLLLTLIGLIASVGQSPRTSPVPEAGQTALLGPIDVVASPDGKTLYVAGADAKQISAVDADGRKVSQSIAMPAQPTGLVLSRDGATLYVTCAGPQGSVAVVDVKSSSVDRLIPVGHGATGPAISPDGKTLYVCNRFDNNVAVVDLATGRITLAPTTREPFAAAVTP
ncbi:YncE family protein, partial [Planctomycetota bacterium]